MGEKIDLKLNVANEIDLPLLDMTNMIASAIENIGPLVIALDDNIKIFIYKGPGKNEIPRAAVYNLDCDCENCVKVIEEMKQSVRDNDYITGNSVRESVHCLKAKREG